MEFLINLSTSAYFSLGLVSVTIVIYIFIIIPFVNHMKQLDNVVMEKLSLLPTTETYSTLFAVITDQNVFNDGLVKEYEETKDIIKSLIDVVAQVNADQKSVRTNIDIFLEKMQHLEMSLEDYSAHLEFNEDKNTKQINSLVQARIDTTTFLIELFESLKVSKSISSDFSDKTLYKIREELRIGVETIKHMSYTSSNINPRSGSVNKVTDSTY